MDLRIALGVSILLGIVASLVAGPTRVRTGAALVPSIIAALLPLFVQDSHGLSRAGLAMLGLLFVLRSFDCGDRHTPFPRRLRMFFSPVDLRRIHRQSARLNLADSIRIVGFLAGATAAWLLLATIHESRGGWDIRALSWLLGIALIYCAAEVGTSLTRWTHSLLGEKPPPMHRDPILSTSLAEFWSKRWNLEIHDWLRRHCFTPLARRHSPTAGLSLAFFASALIHFWIALSATDLLMATLMAMFFLVQGALVLIERRFIQRWSPPRRRAWTMGAMLVTCPLFIEPALATIA